MNILNLDKNILSIKAFKKLIHKEDLYIFLDNIENYFANTNQTLNFTLRIQVNNVIKTICIQAQISTYDSFNNPKILLGILYLEEDYKKI